MEIDASPPEASPRAPAPTFFVVGAGGLGCPALLGLVGSDATDIVVIDPDVVETSNLQRQVLYGVGDVGRPKADAAAWSLRRRDPRLRVEGRRERLRPAEAMRWVDALPEGAIVLECSDSPPLKFALNDACLSRGVPLVVGAALGSRAQVMAVRAPAACYRCIYEAPPRAPMTCDAAGVLGPAVGFAGAVMAALAQSFAHRRETAGRLMAIDLSSTLLQTLSPRARPDCPACVRARISEGRLGQASEDHDHGDHPHSPSTA